MALTFPLSRADFMDRLPVVDVRLSCPTQRQATGLAGGEILTAELAPPLWSGSVTLGKMRARQAAEFEVLISALEVPGRSFLAYKKNQIGPAADPVGAALSGFLPQVKSVYEEAAQLQLQGLPVGLALAVGDYISFDYGTSPVRRALHRVVETTVADALGDTGFFQVDPYLRPGLSIGASVELIRPYCKAVLVPGSVNYGATRNGITLGVSFQFRQSLR